MNDKPPATPLAGPTFSGTHDQRLAIQRLENMGWLFLHWTEIPLMVAVMENHRGDVVFIDHDGRAWTGPGFSHVHGMK